MNATTSPVRLRSATEADIDFIREGLMDSWVEHAKHVPELLNEQRMRQSDVVGYYEKALSSPESIVLVAEMDSKPVGFIRGDISTIASFFRDSRIVFVDDVYVIRSYRRKGIAEKLFAELERIAKTMRIGRMQARVYSFNTTTQQLMKKLGYTIPHSTWDKRLSK